MKEDGLIGHGHAFDVICPTFPSQRGGAKLLLFDVDQHDASRDDSLLGKGEGTLPQKKVNRNTPNGRAPRNVRCELCDKLWGGMRPTLTLAMVRTVWARHCLFSF
jgi:hypothetical protein